MKLDTLTYAYPYQAQKEKLFAVLMDQQLKYFNYYDKNITQLGEGQEIAVKTKMDRGDEIITTQVKIIKIIPNELFQLQTSRPGQNDIIQSFKFIDEDRPKLVCSQVSQLNGQESKNYFFLGAIIYKMLYKSNMKKKMGQLDKLAQ